MDHDEYTFLCGYQKINRYGSTNDLNSHNYNSKINRYSHIISHKVELNDTLQNLELKYNSSMYEIKRLNCLWSNDSLYCKKYLKIPIFDNQYLANSNLIKSQNLVFCDNNLNKNFFLTINNNNNINNFDFSIDIQKKLEKSKKTCKRVSSLKKVDENETESLDEFFKRIDKNVKKTKNVVKQLNKKKFDEINI